MIPKIGSRRDPYLGFLFRYYSDPYTVVGQVIQGMDVVDAIKKGEASDNGSVAEPDYMAKVTVQQ